MSDHPAAITSRPEIFPSDQGLLSGAELRLRGNWAKQQGSDIVADCQDKILSVRL